MPARRPTLALLGAGLFVKDQYMEKLRCLADSVTGAAEGVFKEVRRFSPAVALRYGEAELQLILDDKSIDAVAIVLPALVQPDIVVRALRADKHVIQAVRKALETLEVYKSLQGGQHGLIWAVAENYRFEAGLMKAAELVKELGKLMMVEVFVEAPMNTGNRYYSSQWRRDPDFKVEYWLAVVEGTDIALRVTLFIYLGVPYVNHSLVSGCEATSVSALATHVDEMLPPPDNLAAIMQFDKGCTGAMVMSWSATSRKMSWRVVGENGTVEAERGVEDGQHGYTATLYPARRTPEQSFHPFNGVQEELQVFAEDVAATISLGGRHRADSRSSPLEAIRDLAIVEAMLQSAEKGGSPVAVLVPS
eukprot:SM000075S21940  [mRNA]  locus=s75:111717:115063:- [translate_table: standard]